LKTFKNESFLVTLDKISWSITFNLFNTNLTLHKNLFFGIKPFNTHFNTRLSDKLIFNDNLTNFFNFTSFVSY